MKGLDGRNSYLAFLRWHRRGDLQWDSRGFLGVGNISFAIGIERAWISGLDERKTYRLYSHCCCYKARRGWVQGRSDRTAGMSRWLPGEASGRGICVYPLVCQAAVVTDGPSVPGPRSRLDSFNVVLDLFQWVWVPHGVMWHCPWALIPCFGLVDIIDILSQFHSIFYILSIHI